MKSKLETIGEPQDSAALVPHDPQARGIPSEIDSLNAKIEDLLGLKATLSGLGPEITAIRAGVQSIPEIKCKVDSIAYMKGYSLVKLPLVGNPNNTNRAYEWPKQMGDLTGPYCDLKMTSLKVFNIGSNDDKMHKDYVVTLSNGQHTE